ncbi:uncharacterized protein Z520_06598 [Fonsecaea multimorphosa CBS 102226]|uniref:Kelch repeat protein n=1 Tax=Fonsecaea multimorphosa CBS 102226 TaxID=1442371 RepID=A0A0D2H7L1_9EURO|nr:uncharacterized protein Z520_06598 [Fonsecaea multimorphosa CBS 102226]KIX97820.1 hypothetical protein Z520_06598 [Fonsecaea multimorphosa CBS 102226]OAL23590.1 hypothetical protein AYO22_06167 [Fonsecaea multimorphosa]
MFWATLTALLAVSSVQGGLLRPTISQWFWQSSVVVGDWLYISDGEAWEWVNGTLHSFYRCVYTPQPNEGLTRLIVAVWPTISVDLSQSWTNVSVYIANNSDPAPNMPHRRWPVIWYSEDTGKVYKYGGWAYNSTDWTADLWSFEPGGLTVYWTSETSPSTNIQSPSEAPFGSAWAVGNSTLYSLGGSISNNALIPPNTILPGLVEFEEFSGNTVNSTTNIPNSSPYFNQAKAEFASNFGQAGFLIVVGGANPSEQEFAFEQDTSFRDMADIVLYDASTPDTWYVQRATGDIPPPRTEFCTVGKASSDGKTYELFVYGGMTNTTYDLNNPDELGYLNVYVLSLPAFRWFQTPATTTTRRCSHTCSIIGNRQMVSIGGRPPSTLNQFGADFDEWASGIGVMDMTELQWKDHYDAGAAPYERAQLIQKYYDQSYVEPAWSDPALATEFAFAGPTHASTTPTPHPTTPVPAPGPTTSTPPPIHHSHTGAIAGGVVGGVVGLALVAGLAYFLGTRRNRQTTASRDPVPPPSESKPSEIADNPSSIQKQSPELAETPVFERSELEGETTRQVAELPGYHGNFVPGQK